MRILRRLALLFAALVLTLVGLASPVAAAGHSEICGGNESIGKVGIKSCASRNDGSWHMRDEQNLTLQFWTSATTVRHAKYEACDRQGNNGWHCKIDYKDVYPSVGAWELWNRFGVAHNSDVETRARVRYMTTGGWSAWSSWSYFTSHGD